MRTVLFLALLPFIPVSARTQPQAGDLEAKLSTHVSQYSLSANGLADAVARVAKRFELPVGVEWVKDNEGLRSLSLSWKSETVQGILSSVVKEYPGYASRVDHRVIHVFRRDLREDKNNFLNLKVPDFFEVRQQVGGLANVELREVVQNIVSPRNFPPGAGEGGDYATGIDEKPLTLTLRGLTVREALDKLADASEHKIWIVTFSDSAGLTPMGFRRTETLWHPEPFPDADQPMWDFLAWEEYLPRPAATMPQQPR